MARTRRARATVNPRGNANGRGVSRAGLYARLSVLGNGRVDGDSMETQIELMQRYVREKRDGSRPDTESARRAYPGGSQTPQA